MASKNPAAASLTPSRVDEEPRSSSPSIWSFEQQAFTGTECSGTDCGSGTVQASVNWAGIRAVGGGMIIHCVLGTLYCWGNFNSYTPASLKNFDGSWDPSKSKSADTLMILPFTLVFMAISMPFGATLNERLGPRITALIAGLLCSLAPILSSGATSLGPFVLLYAGILGSGIGLGYMPPMVCGFKHFPTSKGLVSGLILGAFGVGGFIFNKLGTFFLNPNGFQADLVTKLMPPEVTDAFGANFRKLGLVYLAFTLIGSAMIQPPQGGATAAAAAQGWAVVDAVRTKTWLVMWLVITFSAQGGLYVSASYKSIAMDFALLHDDSYLSIVGAVGALSNGFMRPLWGLLYDRFGFRPCFTVLAALQVVLLYGFASSTNSRLLYGLAVLGMYGLLAGNFTLAPAETYRLFGNAAVYGALFSSFALAGVLGGKVANQLAVMLIAPEPDETPNTTEGAFRVLCATSFISLFVLQLHKAPKAPKAPGQGR